MDSIPFNSIVYETALTALVLSFFRLFFFQNVTKRDIDRSSRDLVDRAGTLFKNSYQARIQEYDIDDKRFKAMVFQSVILMREEKERETSKINKRNDAIIRTWYYVIGVLFIITCTFAVLSSRDGYGGYNIANVISGKILMNTAVITTGYIMLRINFYKHFVSNYQGTSDDETVLQFLKQIQPIMQERSPLNC